MCSRPLKIEIQIMTSPDKNQSVTESSPRADLEIPCQAWDFQFDPTINSFYPPMEPSCHQGFFPHQDFNFNIDRAPSYHVPTHTDRAEALSTPESSVEKVKRGLDMVVESITQLKEEYQANIERIELYVA
jgi:hypothetical protein